MGSNWNVQTATTQENTVNFDHENALVSHVAQQELEALGTILIDATATSLQKWSIPDAKPPQQGVM